MDCPSSSVEEQSLPEAEVAGSNPVWDVREILIKNRENKSGHYIFDG
jgi:hypothetical protein